MANESELKQVYRDIEAGEEEMRHYREGLNRRLVLGRRPRTLPWFTWLAVPLAAAAILMLVLIPKRDYRVLDVREPDQMAVLLEQMEGGRERLLERAKYQYQHGAPGEQEAAGVVLALLLPEDEAVNHAALALQKSQDAKYRAFYLELLLDHAGEYRFNPEIVDELMEAETDQLCIKLYESMLKFS